MPKSSSRKKKAPKRVLALPDLEHAKTAVLNGRRPPAAGGRTTTRFVNSSRGIARSRVSRSIGRSCSVTGFTSNSGDMRPATINLRLAAVRRIAYEAADAGLLSPELAAGIRRVKGVRRLGVRRGNWLTPEQGRQLVSPPTRTTPRDLRDHAMLAVLIGCGLRRGELLGLQLASIQRRDDHWVIADLLGKAGHIQTVPMPIWVKANIERIRRIRHGFQKTRCPTARYSPPDTALIGP